MSPVRILSRAVVVLGLSASLTACIPIIHTMNCLDAKTPRDVRPHPYYFDTTVVLDGAAAKRRIYCEEYYDAQCSVRGNGWHWREVGLENYFSQSIQTWESEPDFVVKLPTCTALVRRHDALTIGDFGFMKGSEHLFLGDSDPPLYEVRVDKYMKNSAYPDYSRQIELTWNIVPVPESEAMVDVE